MGTKRIGLARTEALLENLKREIVGFNVETTAASVTTVTAATALVRNTVNVINDTDAAAYTLPAASTCSRGDVIIVKYIAAVADSAIHKYGTAGEFFAAHSHVFADSNAASGGVLTLVTVPDGTDDDFLNLTGATNGGIGIGSELRFHFDGSKWAVNGHLTRQGNGSVAVTAAFGET
jgi:hypothetical protein